MKGQSDVTYSLVDEENQGSSYESGGDVSDGRSCNSSSAEEDLSVDIPVKTKRSKARNRVSESNEEVKKSAKSRQIQKAKADKLRKKIEVQQNKKDRIAQRSDLLDRESKYLDKDITSVNLAQKSRVLELIYSLLSLLTLGLINLINNWTKKQLRDRLIYSKETELEKATIMAITTSCTKIVHVKLQRKKLYLADNLELDTYVFRYNYQTYYYNDSLGCFQNLKQLRVKQKLSKFLVENRDGRSDDEAAQLQQTLGDNLLRLESPSILNRVIAMLSRPASSIKLFSILVLNHLHYKLYMWFVIVYLIYQIVSEIRAERRAFKQTQTAYFFNEKLMIVRNSKGGIHKKKIIDSSSLVPGDLIEITDNLIIPADVVLVHGSCIIEDNFNGPNKITHTKLPIEEGIDCAIDEIPMKSLLITGDKVLFTINHINEGCFGLVVNTGFDSKKGETLRDVIRKKMPNFTYIRDIYILFTMFTVVALLTAFVIIANERFMNNIVPLADSITKICQLLLVALKPAVPMALFAASAYSADRLLKKGISSNDANKLGEIGKTKSMLIESDAIAEDEAGSAGFLLCSNNEEGYPGFEKMISTSAKLLKTMETIPIAKKYVEACGLCHMVAIVNSDHYGSSVDIEMLKSSGFNVNYKIIENGAIERIIETKQHGFSSNYKVVRYYESLKGYPITSVIVENKEGELYLYSKGEPFAFEQICSKSSIPYTYGSTVAKCSNKGFKCTAIGFKKIESIEVTRAELEQGIRFLGFYNSKTALKETVEASISTLNEANVKPVMLTNDSVYLGLSHARQSGICNSTVFIARTVIINHVETLVWQRSDSPKDNQDISVTGEQTNIIDEELDTEDIITKDDCTLAVTGKAFRLLMESEDAIKTFIVEKCRVFANLRADDRLFIHNTTKALKNTDPIVYITNGTGDSDLIYNSDVSISLRLSHNSAIHSFASETGKFSDCIDVIEEGRTCLINRHKNFELVCYFIILQYFGLLLLFTKHTTYAAAQIFFMDIMVLLCTSYFQSNLGPHKLRREIPCRSIFSHKFISSTVSLTSYGIFFMWAIVMLLWKTKFYRSPASLMKRTHDLSADSNSFCDPFIVFIFFVYLNVRFVISNNTNVLLSKNVIKNLGFVLFIVFLLFVPFVLLFANELHNQSVKEVLKAVFKIPELHGFEVLVIIMSVVMLIGFYLVKWAEKKYIRNWAVKNIKADLDVSLAETGIEKNEKEVIMSIRDKASVKESHIEKKSKNSKNSKTLTKKREVLPKKPRVVKRKANKVDSQANVSIGKIEKKNRPLKNKLRRKNL